MNSKSFISQCPNEILVQIMSYLDEKELLIARRVCKRFNEISKNQCLWQFAKCDFYEPNTNKIESFCEFFQDVKELKNLYLQFPNLSDKRIILLNNLFSNLTSLNCLRIRCFDLTEICLPPQLEHLTCSLTISDALEFGPSRWDHLLRQITSMEKCSGIKKLQLEFKPVKFKWPHPIEEALIKLLKKIAPSLECLKLNLQVSAKVIPVIKHCVNLREFVFKNHKYYSPQIIEYDDFKDIITMPHLQLIAIHEENFVSFCSVLENYDFPLLRHLHLKNPREISRKIFNLFIQKIPNLETFLIADSTYPYDGYFNDIVEFIQRCKTIDKFCCNFRIVENEIFSDFVEKLFLINMQRPLKSICLCGPLSSMYNSNNCGLFYQILPKVLTFSCSDFHIGKHMKQKCYCSSSDGSTPTGFYSESKILTPPFPVNALLNIKNPLIHRPVKYCT